MRSNKRSRKKNPLKPQRNFKDYLKFLGIALLILFLVDFVIFSGERPYITKMKQDYWAEQERQKAQKARQEQAMEEAIAEALPPKVVFPDTGEDYFEAAESISEKEPEPDKEEKPKPKPVVKPPKFTGKKAKIVIVIDDVGMNIKKSRAAIDLPSEVTLALLPYASSARDMAEKAKAKGHELIIHTPMEAMNKDVPMGAMALYTDMDKAAFKAEFSKIANAFDGYIGVNNHMGSRLTQDRQAMTILMEELKARNLFFLDSKTIAASIAADVAQENGVPHATRDVFLDHEDTAEFVKNALKKTETVARRHGSAIAIGHPKQVTMQALQKWIPTLEKRGFELVPLSTLIKGTHGTKTEIKAVVQEVPKEVVKPTRSYIEPSHEHEHEYVVPSVSYPID